MNNFLYKSKKLIKKVIHQYFAVDEEYRLFPAENLDEHISVIGTGYYEFFKDRKSFLDDLRNNGFDYDDIQFEIISEEYNVNYIDENVCIVYGKIWIKEKTGTHKPLSIDMNTRFTAICKQVDETIKIVHLHHSIPDYDQKENEFYPKTLTETANAALEYSHYLEEIVKLDSLTKLYNRIAIENMIDEHLSHNFQPHAFFILDIDNFKTINDTFGHPVGDRILVEISQILKNLYNDIAYIGRIGGDEFVVYFLEQYTDTQSDDYAQAIIDHIHQLSQKYHTSISCSIGIAISSNKYNSFSKLFSLADKGLYQSKEDGKERYTKTESNL